MMRRSSRAKGKAYREKRGGGVNETIHNTCTLSMDWFKVMWAYTLVSQHMQHTQHTQATHTLHY